MSLDLVTQCHECGLVQRNPPMLPGGVRCPRCGCTLHRSRRDSLDRTLALTVAGIVLFVVANAFPFLTLEMRSRSCIRGRRPSSGWCWCRAKLP